jgi:hypothetical protein
MKRLILAFALTLLSSAAYAQHPCDLPAQTAPTKGSKFGWCASPNDEDGVPNGSFNFKVFVDGTVRTTWTNATPSNPTPNGAGLLYFEFGVPPGIGRGIHQVSVVQFNEIGDSLPSNIAQWQIGGKPIKPANTAVKP